MMYHLFTTHLYRRSTATSNMPGTKVTQTSHLGLKGISSRREENKLISSRLCMAAQKKGQKE